MGSLDDVLEQGEDVAPGRVPTPAARHRAAGGAARPERGCEVPPRPRRDHEWTPTPTATSFSTTVTVSRRHAEFHRGGSGFTVRDVGSLNGTYVNRERVESATLSNGDEVQIGKFRLVFIAGPRLDDVT